MSSTKGGDWTLRNNVAFLLNYSPGFWGTRDDMLLALCQALSSRGVTPVIVTSEDAPEQSRRRFAEAGAKLETINFEKGVLEYGRMLRRLIHKHSIGTIHIRFFTCYTAVPWIARLLGVRYIVFTDAEPGMLRAVGWRKRALQLRAKFFTLPVSRLIAISEFVKKRLLGVGIREDKIVVIHNAIDVDHYRPDPEAKRIWMELRSLPLGEFVLTTVSFLLPHKEIETLLEAVALLSQRGSRVRFFIAGKGPLRAELEQLSRELGIADQTYWLGYVEDLRPVLQASDVFLLASPGEGFGNVTAEAMACGVPAIVTQSGGSGVVVSDGETGFLLPAPTAQAFAAAIETLAKDTALRQKMGKQARARVKEHFGLAEFAARTMDVYDSIWSDMVRP